MKLPEILSREIFKLLFAQSNPDESKKNNRCYPNIVDVSSALYILRGRPRCQSYSSYNDCYLEFKFALFETQKVKIRYSKLSFKRSSRMCQGNTSSRSEPKMDGDSNSK